MAGDWQRVQHHGADPRRRERVSVEKAASVGGFGERHVDRARPAPSTNDRVWCGVRHLAWWFCCPLCLDSFRFAATALAARSHDDGSCTRRREDAYVVDDMALPVDNPWHRSVRPGDIQFLQDGTGVFVTLDGDVWLRSRAERSLGIVRWRRFASGLHEPLTLAIRDEQIYVFDRNGIWRLRDTNGDGEADVHELFSNAFAQTADMREFPSTIRLAPGGEFVIAKGGQEAATFGKHNGSVLRVSADGRRATRARLRIPAAEHRRQHPHRSRHRQRSAGQLHSQHAAPHRPRRPVLRIPQRQEAARNVSGAHRGPLTWIPHAANASAMSQVWLFGARMGPLNDGFVLHRFQ